MAAVIDDRDRDAKVIVGDGNAEADWRASTWLHALPRHEAQAWLATVPRLVVVSPHPDDETLGCGGLIAEARALDIPVRVVAVTDGEACYAGDPAWPPARTRAVRRRELVRALAALGVAADAMIALDAGDGRVATGEDALVERTAHLLEPGDIVLTTWRHDGHPDHEATARAVRAAAMRMGARCMEFPVWGWHWLDPHRADPRLAGAFACRLSPAARAAKAAALACFASQQAAVHRAPILPAHVLERFDRDFEVLL